MRHLPRILFIVGVIVLLGTFLVPIWSITLRAPQYPHGVTMLIWINKLGGTEPGTLQNINILNHYVGMKMVDPASIPELRYFPKIIVGMVVLGLIMGIFNNKYVWLIWVVILLLLCLLGIYDFYTWLYDYGHNLAPDAPIKIPGQAYQPPLIGSKMLLNFKATSLPHTGSIFIGLSLILTIGSFFLKRKLETTT